MPLLNFFPLVANGYSCLPPMTPNVHCLFFSVIIMVIQEMTAKNENILLYFKNDRTYICKHDFNLCLP